MNLRAWHAALAIPLLLVFASCQGPAQSRPPEEQAPMSLELKLSLGQTDVVVGEDPTFTLALQNTGSAPVQVPEIRQSYDWPVLRVSGSGDKPREIRRRDFIGGGEFTVEPRNLEPQIDPGDQLAITESLLPWSGLLTPGKYQATATVEVAGRSLASNTASLHVRPLNLHAAALAGEHSGGGGTLYGAWTHTDERGGAVYLSAWLLHPSGPTHPLFALLLARGATPLDAIVSSCPNNAGYPVQWVIWSEPDALCGAYVELGRVGSGVLRHPLRQPCERLVGPALLELSGVRPGVPARADFGALRNSGGHRELALYSLDPAGELVDGPTVALRAGVHRGSCALRRSSGDRLFLLAMQHGRQAAVERVAWTAAGAAQLQRPVDVWDGELLAAAATLDEADRVLGLCVIRAAGPGGGDVYRLHGWQIETDDTRFVPPPVEVQSPAGDTFDRAYAAASTRGTPLALLRRTDGEWFVVGADGSCQLLPADVRSAGEPIAVCWYEDSKRFVIAAGAQTGITLQRLPG